MLKTVRFTACLVAARLACAAIVQEATVDQEWNAAFDRSSAWLAGDIGHSIDLRDGRTLWVFGDSLVKRAIDRDEQMGMPRGAIAWHDTGGDGQAPRDMHFAVAEPGYAIKAAGWMAPAPGLFDDGTWYWLMGDGHMTNGAASGRRFVFFVTAIRPAGNPDGMWDFRRVGGAIITVSNPEASPGDWEFEQRRNPLVEPTHRFGEAPTESDNWGMAIVSRPGNDRSEAFLYVYGVRESGGDSQLLVARCAEEALDQPEEWTFFDGRSWSDKPDEAVGIAHGLVSEFTVQAIERGGERQLVLIQSEPWLGRRILARVAEVPEGPWSEPKPIYEVREPVEDKRLITYAAKGHAHLSRSGEQLVSYVLNSSEFGQIVREPRLYRPHFVRVPFELLPSPRPSTQP